MINYKCKIIIVHNEFISKASLLKNLPLPLFAKEGCISSLWQREVRRDFINQCLHAFDHISNCQMINDN
jgi:hypothetical protein